MLTLEEVKSMTPSKAYTYKGLFFLAVKFDDYHLKGATT
jgi:hypothetical protein